MEKSTVGVSMTICFPLQPCPSLSSWMVSSLLSKVGLLSIEMRRGGTVSTACQELARNLDIGLVICDSVLVISCGFEARKNHMARRFYTEQRRTGTQHLQLYMHLSLVVHLKKIDSFSVALLEDDNEASHPISI